jgi:hypothetical protein
VPKLIKFVLKYGNHNVARDRDLKCNNRNVADDTDQDGDPAAMEQIQHCQATFGVVAPKCCIFVN